MLIHSTFYIILYPPGKCNSFYEGSAFGRKNPAGMQRDRFYFTIVDAVPVSTTDRAESRAILTMFSTAMSV